MTHLPPEPAPLPRLIEIMRRLRDPDSGCPWDIAQNFASIAPYTIEEAYEVADAIARNDMADLQAELGDLLLQVVFHAQMAEEAGLFSFADVAQGIGDKMIARHPHVFAAGSPRTAEDMPHAWEEQKSAERARRGETRTLDGVALALPGLLRALKLQKRLGRVGFDWDNIDDVLAKITEEATELAEARSARDADALEDEMGDLLFAMVNLARHLGIDPEAAIRRTNAKVTRRFAGIEDLLAARGQTPGDASLAQMDALWNAVKQTEKDQKDI